MIEGNLESVIHGELPEFHPVIAKQIELTVANDLDGLIELYHPEAQWVRLSGVSNGRDEIREVLAQYWNLDLKLLEVNEYIQTHDTVLTRSTLRIKGAEVVTFGVYVIKDGLIWRQAGGGERGSSGWS